jgi:hypothetical protein
LDGLALECQVRVAVRTGFEEDTEPAEQSAAAVHGNPVPLRQAVRQQSGGGEISGKRRLRFPGPDPSPVFVLRPERISPFLEDGIDALGVEQFEQSIPVRAAAAEFLDRSPPRAGTLPDRSG